MRGTAYSIRQAGGHLFVLTSEAHYAFPGLIADYFSGEMDRANEIGFSGRPIEAVDIYTAYDQLFLMMPDHVMRIPAEEFSRGQNIEAIVAQIDHRAEDWNITHGTGALLRRRCLIERAGRSRPALEDRKPDVDRPAQVVLTSIQVIGPRKAC